MNNILYWQCGDTFEKIKYYVINRKYNVRNGVTYYDIGGRYSNRVAAERAAKYYQNKDRKCKYTVAVAYLILQNKFLKSK